MYAIDKSRQNMSHSNIRKGNVTLARTHIIQWWENLLYKSAVNNQLRCAKKIVSKKERKKYVVDKTKEEDILPWNKSHDLCTHQRKWQKKMRWDDDNVQRSRASTLCCIHTQTQQQQAQLSMNLQFEMLEMIRTFSWRFLFSFILHCCRSSSSCESNQSHRRLTGRQKKKTVSSVCTLWISL